MILVINVAWIFLNKRPRQKAIAHVLGKPLQPSLKYLSKPRDLTSKKVFSSSTGPYPYLPTLDGAVKACTEKHSSLAVREHSLPKKVK